MNVPKFKGDGSYKHYRLEYDPSRQALCLWRYLYIGSDQYEHSRELLVSLPDSEEKDALLDSIFEELKKRGRNAELVVEGARINHSYFYLASCPEVQRVVEELAVYCKSRQRLKELRFEFAKENLRHGL